MSDAEHGSSADTADLIDEASGSAWDAMLALEAADIGSADRTRPLVASEAQLGIWYFERFASSGAPAYHIPTHVRLRGRLDPLRLAEAVNDLVRRHEILRCGVGEQGGEVVLRPRPHSPVELTPESVTEADVEARIAELAAAPFDLAEGPLVRWFLFAVAADDHRLVILQHHIVSDGRSVGLIVRDLMESLAAGAEGARRHPPEPSLHYADFAAFSRAPERRPAIDEALAYWRTTLAGVPALELPTDRPRPSAADFSGGHHHFTVPSDLADGVRRFAQAHRATPYAVLFTVHALLIARYSGQQDFVVTMAVDGRTRPEFETMLGCFVNLLPIRCRIDPTAGFAVTLDATFGTLLDAATFQEAPFHRIVAALAAGDQARDAAHAKVFRSLFTLDSANRDLDRCLSLGDLSAEVVVEADYDVAKTDLSFAMQEDGATIAVRVEFAHALFDGETIARMSGHFLRLLAAALAEPARPVGRLPMMSGGEFRDLVIAANATATPFPRDRSVAALFAEAAERFPEHPAFVDGADAVGYAALNRRAAGFAGLLATAGVSPGHRVAILLDRGLDAVIAIVAAIKAGAAYVPIDPSFPEARIEHMLAAAGARIVVVGPGEVPAFARAQGRIVLRVGREEMSGGPAPAETERGSGDVAYVCFTSGTTGRPRGVVVPDRAIARLVFETNYLAYRPGLRIAFASNIVFDGATLEIWGALLHGGCLVQVPRATLLNVDALRRLLSEQAIDVIILTAPLFHRFADEAPDMFAGVETVLTGGAVVNPAAVARVLSCGSPPGAVLNCYGPTETTTFAATFAMRPGEPIDLSRPLPIGRAIANTRLYVVGPCDEPVPVGVPGELLIGGEGVADGYLGRPELTRAKFFDLTARHPDCPDAIVDERVYRSGDLVRWRPDGLLDFLGRVDRQIKLRGFRVEPGEIEAAMLAHPGVAQAVVVPRGTGPEVSLDAYFAGEAAPDVDALRAHLDARLPAYAIPHRLRRVGEMRVNVSGKIDVEALPAIEPVRAPAARRPGGVTETMLADILADILECPRPGPDDDFFALGGDSIQSIRVAGRVRDHGFPLTVSDIFEHRTVSRIAEALDRRSPAQAARSTTEEGGEIGLTPIQHLFFDLDLAEPGHFNLAILLASTAPLEAGRLGRAFRTLVVEQEALRSRWKPSERRQIVLPASTAQTPDILVHALAGADVAGEIARVCTAWQSGFDIAEGPIAAIGIIRDHPDGRDRLFLAAHHLAIDIVSWWVLVERLAALYDGGDTPVAPSKADSLGRWADELRARAGSAETAVELPRWRQAVAGPSHSDAFGPDGIGEPASGDPGDGRRRFEQVRHLEADAFERAAEVAARRLGMRPNEVLAAAALVAFALETGAHDVTIGVEGHGREPSGFGADVSHTIGWFTSLHPCRVRLAAEPEGGDGLIAALAEVKDALRLTPGGGLGFGLLRAFSDDPDAAALRTWRPDLSVNFLGGLDLTTGGWRIEDAAPGTTVSERNAPASMLDLTAYGARDGFVLALIADARRVDPARAAAFCDRVVAVLSAVAALPEAGEALVTASDQPLSGLDRATLARLLGPTGSAGRKVLRLTPVEEGILFEALRHPESNAYTIQICWRHEGPLDPERLRTAFATLFVRHDALRSRFVAADVPHPVRIVERAAPLPWRLLDWRAAGPEEQAASRKALLAQDRRTPLDLGAAGSMRVAAIRLSEAAWDVVWTIHHVYFDGWSISILLSELAAIYDGGDGLAPAPSFEGFIEAQSRAPEAADRAFWSAQLAGFSTTTDLPFRRPGRRLDAPGPDGASVRIRVPIDPALSAAVEALSAQHAVTASSAFQFAWALLLARCARTDDVVLGTTTSGRTAPVRGIDRMVGLAIATVPVRIRIDEAAPALDAIRTVHQTITEIGEHSQISITELHGLSTLPPDERLFHSLFVFENYPWHRLAAEGELQFQDLEILDKTEMPLTILVILKDRPRFEVAFDPTLLTVEGVEHTCRGILAALAAIIADPACRVGDLDLTSPAERRDLLATWNDTARAINLDRTLLDLIGETVAAHPERIAATHAGQACTYRGLDAASTGLARRLRTQYRTLTGVEMPAETIVALVAERGLAMIVSILAVMKAGGAYLPIDPEDPAERLRFLLEDAAAPIVLADAGTAQRKALAEAFGERVVIVTPEDCTASAESDRSGEDALPAIAPDHLAYVIYTSGSTGRPKGTLVEHRGIVNRLAWVQDAFYALGPDDRLLQKTPYTFDVSVWELFWPLVHGARLVFAEPGGHRDPGYLHRLITDERITVVHFVPSMLQVFVEHPGLERLDSLRFVAASGEGLPTRLSGRMLAALPRALMVNLYGPTEATIEVGGFACSREDEDEGPNTPLGRPAWNTTLHILDEAGRLVPVGVPGELHIGGVQLARGYLNRPDLTAERFVERGAELGRLYRTGDLARRRPDGVIEYLGRIDFQLKIRGMRVEPGEIEVAIEACPGVARACVVVRDGGSTAILTAYVTGDPALSEAALRAGLADRLPEHMVPARIVRLDAFPLTSSGKVDRARLGDQTPAAEAIGALREGAPMPEALSGTEAVVARVYAEVLRAGAQVDVSRSFFALGGHSLTAMRVAMRLGTQLGIAVPVRMIFEHSSVRDLAAALEPLMARTEETAPLVRIDRDGALMATFAQARVLFLEQFSQAPGLYIVPAAMRIRGAFDETAFARAALSLVEAHEILRTRYAFVDGEPRVALHEAALDLAIEDVPAGLLEARLHAEANAGFALERDPPIRFRLLRTGADERILVVTLHHAVIDGWSIDLLLADLAGRYEAALRDHPTAAPDPGPTYLDFAAWQRASLRGERLERQLGYWRERLAGAPPLDIPTARPRPPVASYRGGEARFALDRSDAEELERFCTQTGTTLFPVLLAAWSLVLSRYCGQREVVIGTPIASRPLPETEHMIGLFQNLIPLRVRLDEDEAVSALVSRLSRETTEDFAHQDVPFQLVIEALGVARDPSRPPLFQAMIILDGGDPTHAVFAPAGTQVTMIPLGSATAKVDLTAAFARTAEGLSGAIEYASDLFDAPAMDRLGTHLSATLRAIAAGPFERVGEVDILPFAERKALIERFNATRRPSPAAGTVLDRFRARVEAEPDAVAACHGTRSLSYRALDARATRLAQAIRERHRGLTGEDLASDTVVALLLERGLAMIVAILAVMKAGGAYLPISPDDPAERVAFLLGDAGAALVIAADGLADRPAAAACPADRTIAPDAAPRDEAGALPRIAPAQLAYVMYTSGSTGRPKATAIEHRSLANRMDWVQGTHPLSREDSVVQKTPYTFDVSVSELLWPLCAGARLVFADPGGHRDPAYLHRLIADERITVAHFVPSMLQVFSEQPGLERLADLRLLVLIGEPLPARLASRILGLLPAATVINFYGPTEATIDVSAHACTIGEEAMSDIVPIGLPGWNTALHVIDAERRLLPIGVPGELAIGGAQLARGYLNRPDLTAASFIDNPFGPGRLYRTGDRVRRRGDGVLEFLGRLDHQLKIRGIRIEPGEIEARLEACPGVAQACCLAAGPTSDPTIVAYVACDVGLDVPALRARLAAELPEAMLPARIIALDAFPLTANGKIDRAALPAVEAERPLATAADARTPTERALVGIWRDLLGHERFSCEVGFFDAGGSSLSAMRMVGAVAERLGRTLPIVSVFLHPTVRALAAELDAAGDAPAVRSDTLDRARQRSELRRNLRASREGSPG